MKEPVWVQPLVVMGMHEMMIVQHGGSAGVRDEGLLESALAGPQRLFNYGTPDLAELAAAHVAGVVRNHPFIDGNKRSGFMAGYVLLTRNGLRLEAPEAEAAQMVLALAAAEVNEAQFAAWLRDNVKRQRAPRK